MSISSRYATRGGAVRGYFSNLQKEVLPAMDIHFAKSDADIRACFPAMSELRPHLTEEAFVSQVKRQMQNHGYSLVYILGNHQVVAAAGYRVAEYLAWGKAFYLDDLITASSARKKGYGSALMDWLLTEASNLGCTQLHLDSGTHRHDAHRLYMSRKLKISSHHFSKDVE
jgi:GNAT superfamily N-acetyltransferase